MAKVLIIIPHDGFRDEEFVAVYENLKNAGHEVLIASTHHTEAQGHFGILVKPDLNIGFVEPKDFECYVFIGGRGIEEFKIDSSIQNLIRTAFSERILLCAIGMAVELLLDAGVLTGRRVTCDTASINLMKEGGAYYTSRLVQVDGEIITASGVAASKEFAEEIIGALKWRDERKAPIL